MKGERNFSLEAERKSKVRERGGWRGRSRSLEEKEQGSGLVTGTDGDRKTGQSVGR